MSSSSRYPDGAIGAISAVSALFLAVTVAANGCSRQQAPRPDAATTTGGSAATRARADASTAASDPFSERVTEREAMVSNQLRARGIKSPAVLRAMRRVPRHAFVPASRQRHAYDDRPLPIGNKQTISQPFIVAYMTQAVSPDPYSKCLEIGTGSGYQAAVLAEMCEFVYSIEYLPDVARFGKRNLRALGYGPTQVQLRVGDGYRGWPEAAPFDVIIVTAAPDSVPAPLLEQLAVGGRLVIPVGQDSGGQRLELWRREKAGGSDEEAFKRTTLIPVRFVPFLGPGEDSSSNAPKPGLR